MRSPSRLTLPTAPKRSSGLGGWLALAFVMAHLLLRIIPLVGAFIVVTAFLSPHIEAPRYLAAAGLAIVLVPAILLRLRLDTLIDRFSRSWLAPSLLDLTTVTAIATCVLFCIGFADATGRNLRRHGDWFLGEHNGLVARVFRAGIDHAALALERFDPPPEVAPIVVPMMPRAQPGPWAPDVEPPPDSEGMLAWFHPLAGPRRAMPLYASRRFGAVRPQPRPTECELGHCGVDLGTTLGEPVFAIADGVIERIELDETAGGRAGKYVRMSHKSGTVVSRYIHIDSVVADLHVGQVVHGGEMIARLGRSGVEHSGPHLHFGLSLRESGHEGGKERYIDPEPLLRVWRLPEAPSGLVAQR